MSPIKWLFSQLNKFSSLNDKTVATRVIFCLCPLCHFSKMSHRQRVMKITCVTTLSQATRQTCTLSRKIQHVEFLTIFFSDLSTVESPVRGWLHMRFLPRAGDTTIFKQIASPSQAKMFLYLWLNGIINSSVADVVSFLFHWSSKCHSCTVNRARVIVPVVCVFVCS